MITETNSSKAKQLIKNSKSSELVIQSQTHEFNRSVIEYGKFSYLLFPNISIKTQRKLKTIDSGLDRVSAKAAAKNKITILYDLSKLHPLNKKFLAFELEKLMEIIKLCKKNNVKFRILNYKEDKNAFAFLTSLKASSQQVKQALSF